MRNAKKDAAEMAEKRERMLEKGFCIFADRAIEAVTMQEIADACEIGIATLYRYFNTKLSLVIAIGTRQWEDYYKEIERIYAERDVEHMTAAEEFEFYLNAYVRLYKEHKDILRFNWNFVAYIRHEAATAEQMKPYNDALNVFARKFHKLYVKAEKDGTLRTDVSENKLFVSSMHTMLPVAGKYAVVLVYPPNDNGDSDRTEELVTLKDMILKTYTAKGPGNHEKE